MKLRELAKYSNAEVIGNPDEEIKDIEEFLNAKEKDITLLLTEENLRRINESKASAFIVKTGVKLDGKNLLVSENPKLTFAKVISLLRNKTLEYSVGIHPSCFMEKDVKIGENVSIQAWTYLSEGVEISDSVVICPFVFIGKNVKIGEGSFIYPHVVIRENVFVGKRVIIHSGTVIGSDGFGYVKDKDGIQTKIPQVGTVLIEDNVEIGANVTIDRATLGKTVIKKGTKIDNLVQVAHNVVIGEDGVIAAQTGISGSVVIGKNVAVGGQVGLSDHIVLGDNVTVYAQSGVSKDVSDNTTVFGCPAKEKGEAARSLAEINNIPKIKERIKELEKKVKELEEKSKINDKEKL